jgi:hypothetical protein
MTIRWVAAALATGIMWPAGALKAENSGVVLAPHRAVYEMILENARGGSDLASVSGRMVYEITGSPCEGYTQNMRFVTLMLSQKGASMMTDLRSSSWEDGSGRRFRFNSTQVRDEKTTEATVGDAARASTSDEIKVELTKPTRKDLSLPAKVYFPVQHTIALLKAARSGAGSFRADLYDGSEKGDKVYDTVALIGRRVAAGGNKTLPPVKNADKLDELAAWPVSIAYFEPGADKRDATPSYELSFWLFENGVSRRLSIDYGDFSIRGELTQITFHEPSKCAIEAR